MTPQSVEENYSCDGLPLMILRLNLSTMATLGTEEIDHCRVHDQT